MKATFDNPFLLQLTYPTGIQQVCYSPFQNAPKLPAIRQSNSEVALSSNKFELDDQLFPIEIAILGGTKLVDKVKNRKLMSEDDEKTKSISSNHQDNHPFGFDLEQNHNERKNISKTTKELIRLFREWVKLNNPKHFTESKQLRQCLNQQQIIKLLTGTGLGQVFFMFELQYCQSKAQKKIAKKAQKWVQLCSQNDQSQQGESQQYEF